MAPDFPLMTPRLAVRPFVEGDEAAMRRVYGDPEVMRHVGSGGPAAPDEVAAMLAHYRRHQAEHGFSSWAVIERASGAVIGDAGFEARDDGAELGYTLARERWGHGFATEVGRLCVAVAFDALRLPWCSALVDPANPASAAVLDKLGFVFTGQCRAYGRPHHAYLCTPPMPGPGRGVSAPPVSAPPGALGEHEQPDGDADPGQEDR